MGEITARMRRPRSAAPTCSPSSPLTARARSGYELAERLSADRLREATDAVLDYCERRTRACIAAMPDGTVAAQDVLEAADRDLLLRLPATVDGDPLLLDFSASAPQHEGNLNCPLAVTRSACLFAVRVLTDPDIPPTAGAYRPVSVTAPLGTVLNAHSGAAVAAGNVETSSRVADLVLSAFGRAQGQGTMNNLTLGDERFSYYETLGGGQGACEGADGPSAVHVAMSNTLNTPIEALEREFPLRVVEYALRRGFGRARALARRGRDRTGGAGTDGDDLFADRRAPSPPPPGAGGGGDGAAGRDLLDGRPLAGKSTGVMHEGQRLRIETPGGGGFGDEQRGE